jgi:hypothetical protein
MPVVQHILLDPSGAPIAGKTVTITLVAGSTGGFIGSNEEVLSRTYATTDATGLWTATLASNTTITPPGTYYLVTQLRETLGFVVPAGAGPWWLHDILAVTPASPAGLVIRDAVAVVDNGDGTYTITTGGSAAAIGADAAGTAVGAVAAQHTADNSTYVPQALAQTAETTALPIFTITPKTAGFATFQVHQNSFANSGAGAGTYNHTVHIGWNASRHSAGPGTVAGKPSIYMGFEDNYFDYAGDLRFGEEWYVGYASPDGVSVPVTALRSFYTRIFSDTNVAKGAQTFMEIGTDGTGSWQVRTADASLGGGPLLYMNGVGAKFSVPLTVEGITATFQSPVGSGLNLLLNAKANNPALIFQRNAAASWTIQANSTTTFYTYDKDNRAHIIHTYGATAATAKSEFSAALQVDGVLSLGSATTTPTVAATANDGGSPPTPTVTGNASRGVVGFGTGTAPAAGATLTVTLPAGYASPPTVVLSAGNYAAYPLNLYVIVLNSTQFQICSGGGLGASQPADTYKVNYVVIG